MEMPFCMHNALPTLTASQREVLTYLDMALEERDPSWLKLPFPVDTVANKHNLDAISLLELASICFLDESCVLQRYKLNVRKNHSNRIHKDAEDHDIICLPRALRLQVLTLYHEAMLEINRIGAFARPAELWWPMMADDNTRFVVKCHVCASQKASHVSDAVPHGQNDVAIIPGEDATGDVLGPSLRDPGRG